MDVQAASVNASRAVAPKSALQRVNREGRDAERQHGRGAEKVPHNPGFTKKKSRAHKSPA